MPDNTFEFATSEALIRKAIECHRPWVEKTLGVTLAEAVILQVDISLAEAAIGAEFKGVTLSADVARIMKRLNPYLDSIEVPPSLPPLLQLSSDRARRDWHEPSVGFERRKSYAAEWCDLPVAIHLRDSISPLIAIKVSYHAGPESACACEAKVVIVERSQVSAVVRLLEDIGQSDGLPKLHIHRSQPQPIDPCAWDQLVLSDSLIRNLKEDFESFVDRREWFQKMKLPFRRGYLLHGPPGNGKTSAIRAMMTSRSLSAYTIRCFDPRLGDNDLDELFQQAARNTPCLIVFEDIDRAFPRTGAKASGISLQQLLNSLDGLGSADGVVVVATANEPTILDPAILSRPGRFDRVLHFGNPTAEQRSVYFVKMAPHLSAVALSQVASMSHGFSFAQLREAYVIAGQSSFLRDRDICVDDLTSGIDSLRTANQRANKREISTGFQPRSNELSA